MTLPNKADIRTLELAHDSMASRDISTVDLEDDPHRAALEDNPLEAEKPSWSTLLAVLFLGLSFVGPVAIGFATVTSVIVQIGTDLGDVSTITWIVGAWSIASSVSFSIAGSVSDIFGRRYPIIAGNIATLVGAIVSATANTTTTVIAGMTLLGFGCGIVFVGYAGIPELLPNKWRGIGLGFTEFCIVIPWAGLAVLLGNEITTNASWRWIFYISAIYAGICLVGTTLFYYPPSRPQRDYEKSRWQELAELDYTGITLYTSGLTVFLVGLTWAGSASHPWKSASVIAPIVLGIALFIGCFAYDWTIPKQPFFPFRLFRQLRDFSVLLVLVFVSGMVFYCMSALLPRAALYMFTHDPTQIGIISIPGGLSQVLGGFILPALVHRLKHVKIQMITALIVQTLAIALYSTAVPGNRAAWMAFQFFGQGCFPLITVLCYVTAGLHVRQKDLGIATGLIGTFRSAGGSVGNAIFNAILNSVVGSQLRPRISSAALSSGYTASHLELLIPAVIEAGSGVPPAVAFAKVPSITPAVQVTTHQAFREAYAYAFRRVFWSTIPFGVLAIIAACFIHDPSMYLTNHVAVHMQKEVLPHQDREKFGLRDESQTVDDAEGGM